MSTAEVDKSPPTQAETAAEPKPHTTNAVADHASAVPSSASSAAPNEKEIHEGHNHEALARETMAVEAAGEKANAEMTLQRTRSSVHNPQDGEVEYPKGAKLFTITLALCLAVLCVALDNTIIATAIPYASGLLPGCHEP